MIELMPCQPFKLVWSDILSVTLSCLVGCNGYNARNNNHLISEEIYLENFPNSTNICYNDKDFYYKVSAINNNGSISGTISSMIKNVDSPP